MIGIRINSTGKFLDLPVTFSLPLRIEGVLFRSSLTAKTYSMPVQLGWTKANAEALGYAYQPMRAVVDDTQSWAVSVFVDGVEDYPATLQILRFTDTSVEFYLLRAEFPTVTENTRLRDIDLGGTRSIVPTLAATMHQHATDLIDTGADTTDYCFGPLENPSFYNNAITYDGIINSWYFTGSGLTLDYRYIPTEYEVFTGGHTDEHKDRATCPSYAPFVPFPYLIYVLRQIAAHYNVSLSGDFLNETDVDKLVIYNTYALDEIEERYSATYGSSYYVNNGGSTINLANHVPDITISDFLKSLAGIFNLKIDLNEKTLSIVKLDGIAQANAEEDLSPYLAAGFEGQPGTGGATGITFQIGQDPNDARSALYTTPINSSTMLDDSVSVTATTGQQQYVSGTGSEFEAFTCFSPVLRIGDGAEDLGSSTAAGIIGTHRYDTSVPQRFGPIFSELLRPIMPITDQVGNSSAYAQIGISNPFSLRLLLYLGEQKIMSPNFTGGGASRLGPLLTSVGYDSDGDMLSNIQLKLWGHPDSIYPKWHQRWGNLVRGKRTYIFSLKLSRMQLKMLDTSKKYRIGNRIYLIKSIEATQTHTGLRDVKMTVVQVG